MGVMDGLQVIIIEHILIICMLFWLLLAWWNYPPSGFSQNLMFIRKQAHRLGNRKDMKKHFAGKEYKILQWTVLFVKFTDQTLHHLLIHFEKI
jgi:hypothetical protein